MKGHMCRLEDNISTDLKGTEWKYVVWVQKGQNLVYWEALVKVVINVRLEILTSVTMKITCPLRNDVVQFDR